MVALCMATQHLRSSSLCCKCDGRLSLSAPSLSASPSAREEALHPIDREDAEIAEGHLAEVRGDQLLQSRGRQGALQGKQRALVVDVPGDVLATGLVLLQVGADVG